MAATGQEHDRKMKPDNNALPYFRMYASVILADTNFNGLSDCQTGWYFRLMLESWFRAGFLPENDETLRSLCGNPRRDRWDRYKSSVLFYFDRVEHDGQNFLVNAGLRQQWLKANEAYDKKQAKKLTAQPAKPTVRAALPPASERNFLTLEEFARLVRKPLAEIHALATTSKIKMQSNGTIHRDEARKL
ncbi:MAG: hypothetical protein ACJ72H_28575 [Candidatus Sulfotelmatobacter sp.]